MINTILVAVSPCSGRGGGIIRNEQEKLTENQNLKTENWLCKNENCGRQRLEPNKKNLGKIRNTEDKK